MADFRFFAYPRISLETISSGLQWAKKCGYADVYLRTLKTCFGLQKHYHCSSYNSFQWNHTQQMKRYLKRYIVICLNFSQLILTHCAAPADYPVQIHTVDYTFSRQLQWWLKYLALWFRFASERYLGSSVGSWERKTGNGEWPMGNGAMTTNGQPQCARRTLHRLQAFLTMPPLRCCVAVLIQNQQFLRFSGRLNMFKHSLRWRSSLGASN